MTGYVDLSRSDITSGILMTKCHCPLDVCHTVHSAHQQYKNTMVKVTAGALSQIKILISHFFQAFVKSRFISCTTYPSKAACTFYSRLPLVWSTTQARSQTNQFGGGGTSMLVFRRPGARGLRGGGVPHPFKNFCLF